MKPITPILPALTVLAALAGCASVEQPYQRPDVGLADNDTFAAADGAVVQPAAADLHWWRRFGDPVLTQWVERALAGNLEVAAAFERVAQAQALLQQASATRRPTVGTRAQTGASRRRSEGGTTSGNQSTSGGTASVGLNVEWDADLWGGLHQAEQSAAAELLRTEDLAQAARLATAGTAARGYVEWRAAQNEQQVLDETLGVREDNLRLAQARVDAGLAPTVDVTRAQADVATARAERDDAAGRARQAQLALHVLTGRRPDAQALAPASPAPIPNLEGEVPVPRPIDLLRLRPDVRAAERALVAAYADVGVARAALYPQLRLPGELLVSAAGIGTGNIVNTLSASLSAILDATLFDNGRRQAGVDAAASRAREAALVYRQTVLEALEQVESALIARSMIASQYEARVAAARASERALEQARTMYKEGLAGFGDVLEAQRNALENRMQLTDTRAAQARAAIAMFEAVGVVGS